MERLTAFGIELESELKRILDFWQNHGPDTEHGGIVGQIDYLGKRHAESEKGSVLHARVLWTFSAAYNLFPTDDVASMALRARDYLISKFYDEEQQGLYWSLHADGSPKDRKNQVYALAFAIYGLSEHYRTFGDRQSLSVAEHLFHALEGYSLDEEKGGYLEAFTHDWQPLADARLSEKDANEKKTMNTHLHIAEAYANLYRATGSDKVQSALTNILELIADKFYDPASGRFRLFFNEDWVEKPDVVSFGHDIEAGWLLLDCAEAIRNESLISRYKKMLPVIADAAKVGLDTDGGLWYEYDPQQNFLVREKHWWPQAEAMLGYFAAWEVTGNSEYLHIVLNNWAFVKKHLLNAESGEWNWGIDANYRLMEKDLAGFWKCPYHNGRACMELIERIKKISA